MHPIRLTRLGAAVLVGSVAVGSLVTAGTDREVLALVVVVGVGLMAIGLVWPVVTVARVQVALDAPRRARQGEVTRIGVSARRAGAGVVVRVLDPTSSWSGTVGGDMRSHVVRREDARTSRTALRVEVRAEGPIGLASAGWARMVALDAPMDVGPAFREGTLALDEVEGARPDPVAAQARAGELVRGLRPYVAGDPARLVHWASTARVGALVVREVEPPSEHRVAVRLDLRAVGDEADAVVAIAAEVVHAALAAGAEVHLASSERGLPVARPVRSVADATRRLSRATPGPVGPVPPGWPLVEARDWWRATAGGAPTGRPGAPGDQWGPGEPDAGTVARPGPVAP